MKVLFAINNESTVDSIIKHYKVTYGEKIDATKVYFFRNITETLKKDKTFDRIVIHEELEPTARKNQDLIDTNLLKNIDRITDEAGRADIIFICSENRRPNDKLLKSFFNLGIYNVLTGQDRTVGKLAELINRPRTKKEAKMFVDVDIEENPYDVADKVDEEELRNIIRYYEKNIFSREKIVSGFDSLYEQYTFEKLKQIVPFLPQKAREILQAESEKYIAIMSAPTQKTGKHARVEEKVRVVEVPVYIQEKPKEEVVEKPKAIPPEIEPVVRAPKVEPVIPKVERVTPKVEPIIPEAEPVIEKPKPKPQPEPPKVEMPKSIEVVVEQPKPEPELPKAEPIVEVKPEPELPKIEPMPEVEPEPELPKVEMPKKIEIVEKPEPPKPELPKVEPVMPKVEPEPELPKVEPVIPEVEPEPELPKVEPVMPEIEPVIERPQPVMPKVEPVMPKVEPVIERPQPVMPKVEPVMPEAEPIIERPKPVMPKVEPVIERPTRPEPQPYAPPSRYQPPRPSVMEPQIQTVTQVIEKEVIKEVYETPKDYKKTVCFIGAHKTGTTFIINALANVLAAKGVKTAIIDLTRNKDSFLIYAAGDSENARIAANSLNNLVIGQLQPLKLGILSVYTGIPRADKLSRMKYDVYKMIELVKRENSVVLIDCNFETPLEVFRFAQSVYVVQDMDVMNILPITMFLKELKEHEVDMEKCSVIINKYMKSSLTPSKIMEALAFYNNPNPDMLVYDELLPKSTKRFIIPFDEQNYLRYIENLYSSKMNFSGFSDEFKQAISIIIQEIFPIGGRPMSRNVPDSNSGLKGLFRKR